MRATYWICAVLLAFLLGILTEKLVKKRPPLPTAPPDQTAALAGIEKLHELDKRVTILNDPKALQQLWTDDAVRLAADGPPDIAIHGKVLRMVRREPTGEWKFSRVMVAVDTPPNGAEH